jgi:hypothetical protein
LFSFFFFFSFLFFSFASSEAQEILKSRANPQNGNSSSNHEAKSNSVSHLFKVASQEIETTYARSLEISEKYQSNKK